MQWSRFHRLVDETVARLRNAEGDREKIEAAIHRYLGLGHRQGISTMVLWPSFVISSPS